MKHLIITAALLFTASAFAETMDFETLILSNEGTCMAVAQATTATQIQVDQDLMRQDITDSGFDFQPDALCTTGGAE